MQSETSFYVSDGTGGVRLEHHRVEPAPGQVLIRTEYAGINRGDVLGLRGAYGAPTPDGTRVGQDIVGIVEHATNPAGADLVGQRVFGQISGAWGNYATADPAGLTTTGTLEPEVAVTLPLAGVTALRLARQAQQLAGNPAGHDVLITGGTGAVGTMLSQLLADKGCTVWLPTRRKIEPTVSAIRPVASLDDVPDVAVAFESVGGATFAGALAHVRQHGHLWWFGEASRQHVTVNFFDYLNRSPLHIHHFAHWIHDGHDTDDLNELRSLAETGRLQPPATKTITADELPDALDGIATNTLHERVIVQF